MQHSMGMRQGQGLIRTVFVAVLLAFAVSSSQAQQDDAAIKFRLAQSFEQSGDWERAAFIYETLLQADPQNYIYFDGLRRSYVQLKEYEKAVRLVQQRLTIQRNDPALLSSLGGLLYQMGEESAADSVWQSVVRSNPANPNLYRLVATQMIEYRLYDEAIRKYIEARAATNSKNLFSEELAALYGALMQYESAAREYISMLQNSPQQISYVQSRLSAFSYRPEGLNAVLSVAKDQVKLNPNFSPLRSLLAWLFMEKKDYDSALEEYRVIDRLTKANGMEIFNFGQRAAQESMVRVAAKAFKEIIDKHPSKNMLPQARFGYARAIEQLSVETDTALVGLNKDRVTPDPNSKTWPVSESQPSYAGALVLYESLIRDYPNTEISARSLFRSGVIKREQLHDLDGAMRDFGIVREMPMAGVLALQARMHVAEILTAQNNLATARAEYASMAATPVSDLRGQALFRVSELDYFESRFDSALTTLRGLTSNVNTDLANDALQLLYFIQENVNTEPAALSEFAKADLLIRQRKYAEALARFTDIKTRFPAALLIDDAVMKMGELYLKLQKVDEAIKVFGAVVTDMPASILRDRAQMQLGEIYQNILRHTEMAIEAYEQVLIRFPNSLYVEEARKRIRQLRGEAI